ncbi:MAG: hypothetical protein OXG82_00275 [Gammaproteobacteria bacterium]|nr:hypothetical protein [Gammaproteobacteria bacterium]
MRNWLRERKAERDAKREADRARRAAAAKAERDRVAAEKEAERKREADMRQLKTNVLAILDDGKYPHINFTFSGGTFPFKLLKSERLVWVFQEVEYLERKIRREVVGRSSGMSVRVMKGVSVRVGQSRGTPVETEHLVSHGKGLLAVATKNIYFRATTGKSVRMPFAKIVSVAGYSDAVEVTRDRASGLPEYFEPPRQDVEFLHDLLHSIPASEVTTKSEVVSEPSDYHLLDSGHDDVLEHDGE